MAKDLTFVDADNAKRIKITVEPGALPYTTKISFGNKFTITLHNEDALRLAYQIEEDDQGR